MSVTYAVSGLIYLTDERNENFDYVVALKSQTEHDENVVLTQEEFVEMEREFWGYDVLSEQEAKDYYAVYKADMEKIANLQGQNSWINRVQSFLAITFGTIVFVIDVMTFNVPHMPSVVRLGLNAIFLPMLALFLLGIYPYIKDFVFAITTMVARFIDAIVPG